jgi:hypothetical protein
MCSMTEQKREPDNDTKHVARTSTQQLTYKAVTFYFLVAAWAESRGTGVLLPSYIDRTVC